MADLYRSQENSRKVYRSVQDLYKIKFPESSCGNQNQGYIFLKNLIEIGSSFLFHSGFFISTNTWRCVKPVISHYGFNVDFSNLVSILFKSQFLKSAELVSEESKRYLAVHSFEYYYYDYSKT